MISQEQEIGGTIRGLMRHCLRVGLGTIDRGDGGPYVSLAMVAMDHDAAPLLYLSDLADHTANLKRDARVSLLFDGTLASAVPLAGERATTQGRIARVDEPRLLARYVALNPDAAVYAGFRDFNLYRVAIDCAHLVAGFGRIHWVEGAAVTLDRAAVGALPEAEPGVLAHMNGDHADAVQLYANRLLERPGDQWRMVAIDPDGCDLGQGGEVARLPFDAPIRDAAGARAALVTLAGRARGAQPA